MNPNSPSRRCSLSHTERLDCRFPSHQTHLEAEPLSNNLLEWYRDLYNNSPIIYFTLDLDGVILAINQTGVNVLGYESKHIMGQPIFQFIHQSDIPTLNAVLKKIPGQTETCECRILSIHRQWLWVKASLTYQNSTFQQSSAESLPAFCEINLSNSGYPQTTTNSTILLACEDITTTKQLNALLSEERLFTANLFDSTDTLLRYFISTALDADIDSEIETEQPIHPIVFVLDASQNIIYGNKAGLKILGKTLEEIQGYSFNQLFPKQVLSDLSGSCYRNSSQELSSLQPDRNSYTFTTHILTPEGKDRYIRWSDNAAWMKSIAPSQSTEPNLKYTICTGIDITEQWQTQEALKASEDRYKKLLENSFDAIAICCNNKIVQANSSFVKLTGLTSREKVINCSISQFLPSLSLLESYASKADFNYRIDTTLRTTNNTEIPVQVIVTLIAWNEQSAQQFVIHQRDINPKLEDNFLSQTLKDQIDNSQNSERQLQQSHEQIINILESIADAFFAVNQDFQFTYINREAEILLQRSREELIGRQIWQEFPEAIRSTFFQKYEQAISQQTPITFEEFYPSLNRWFSVHVYLATNGGLSVYFNDITEHKATELLKQQQTERERIIAQIQTRIHQSLNLEEILNITVAEVRQFLETDRVFIYRFNADWSGIVEVESVDKSWISMLGMVLYDPCFAQNYRSLYQQGRVRAIDDLTHATLQPCHLELLEQFQVKATLIVPIVQNNALWGLLIAHHCRTPRHWQPLEVELLQSLATQVGIAIEQSQLYQQVQQLNFQLETQINQRTRELQESLNFAAVLKRITDRVRESLDEHQILQTAVEEVAGVLKVDYCASVLYNGERTAATVSYESTHPEVGSALGQVLAMNEAPKIYAKLLQGEYFAAYESGRYQFFQWSELGDLACPDLAKSMVSRLLCPIFDDQGAIGHLTVLHQTYRMFSTSEIHLVQQVASQCAIALRQARLYQASQAQVEQLQKLSRLKDEFLSTVSHELRTPMSNMKLAIQMLKIATGTEFVPAPGTPEPTQTLNPQKATRYLKILQDECEREISLINDLLDLQRLDAGVRPFHGESLNLQEWIPQIVLPFQDRTSSRQQTLNVDCPDDLPWFICDPASLERVLAELLNNACKYTPPHETITIRIGVVNEMMKFEISNSGVEIPPEELPHIFEKFYRVPSADPWKQGGTGLGLALVQKLIDHLEGTIKVDSQQGQTCFTVELPLTAHT
jgi:PAS domain S-box-containing protein